MKYLRDALADQIFPGKAAGQADNDPRLNWEYAQEKGENSVRIEIYFPIEFWIRGDGPLNEDWIVISSCP